MIILKRLIGIFIAIIPFAIVLSSSLIDWRPDPIFSPFFAGYPLFVIGGFISCLNFYLSFLRYPVFLLRGGKKENYRSVSGLPLVGCVSVIALIFLPRSIWLSLFAFIFLIIDTGGISWAIISVWKDDSFWNNDKKN